MIIDIFSRKVIRDSVANHLQTELLVHVFDKAVEMRNPNFENLTFHSNQGCQFTEFDFRRKLENLNIKQSFSSPETPYDNAVAESFFSCLKREQLYVSEVNDFNDLLLTVEHYIGFYNDLRPHQSLAYKTPSQVEMDYTKTID